MKIRFSRRLAAAIAASVASIVLLSGCGLNRPYKTTSFNFAGRPTPPSQLLFRVGVAVNHSAAAGTGGAVDILDASRDIRSSVYNANQTFSFSGAVGASPVQIFNYPEQQLGYIYSSDGGMNLVNYSTESASGSSSLPAPSSQIFGSSDAAFVLSAEETVGLVTVVDNAGALGPSSYSLPMPGAYRVAVNPSHTVALIMKRNTDQLFRLIKINQGTGNTTTVTPSNAVSCMPLAVPLYCIVPVNLSSGTLSRPYGAYYSPDGSQAYVLNAGPELAGNGNGSSGITFLNLSDLLINNYPVDGTNDTVPVAGTTTAILGGATAAISDGTTLYVAGQQYQPDGLLGGVLTTLSVSSHATLATYSISDGTHTKMLFSEGNNLWIGSSNCASGERIAHTLNYNCLTRFNTSTLTPSIVPAVNPAVTGSTLPYPNADQTDPFYYGSLTGICWIETFQKVYTAYGGQVHIFSTVDGSEIYNGNVTVQGEAQDVAYLDADTNVAN